MTIMFDIMDVLCILILGVMIFIALFLWIVCAIATWFERRRDKHDNKEDN